MKLGISSHELARILLENEDLPVVTHANNHTSSAYDIVRVGLARAGAARGVMIGNFTKRNWGNSGVVENPLWLGNDLPLDWRNW